MSCVASAERDIKVVRPLYSVEVIETETAKFETDISEEDLHATWKLKEETLHPSAVRTSQEPTSDLIPEESEQLQLSKYLEDPMSKHKRVGMMGQFQLKRCVFVPGRGDQTGRNPTHIDPL